MPTGDWIGTLELVLTGSPQQVPLSDELNLATILGSGTFAWGFAATAAGPFFPVVADHIQDIPYDPKGELWVQGSGTLSIAVTGQGGPILGNVSPPSVDALLQEDGFALLQESGSLILL